MGVSKRVGERLHSALRRLVPILEQQRARDVSEADTVTLVKDLLAEAFGYDKYSELTSEFQIRGTYCDLAVRIEGKVAQLIEVKAIGISLDDRHVKQAVDYAANQGIEWVLLTNGATWRIYQVIFGKPIDRKLLVELDLTRLDPRREDDLAKLHLLCREGFTKGAHLELRDRKEATSRYLLAALLRENDAVLSVIRRELRRAVDVLVSEEEILRVLHDEVLKRDAVEGPEAEQALRRIQRAGGARQRRAASDDAAAASSGTDTPAPAADAPSPTPSATRSPG